MQDGSEEKDSFYADLTKLINSKCLESASNTPDFLLAEFLAECLKTYNRIVKKRDEWHGWHPDYTKAQISQGMLDLHTQYKVCSESLDQAIELLKQITMKLAKGEDLPHE